MAAPIGATSLDNVQNLTNIDDIQKAYQRLCKEEVHAVVIYSAMTYVLIFTYLCCIAASYREHFSTLFSSDFTHSLTMSDGFTKVKISLVLRLRVVHSYPLIKAQIFVYLMMYGRS